jgi:transcriptional regulator with XRE-family HTH domain
MKLKEAVEKAKQVNSLTSDRGLAKLIGVSDVTILSWRHGTHLPKPEHAQRLAELAEIDPAPFVAQMLIDSTDDSGLKSTLERFKRAVAALLILAATLPASAMITAYQCILCKIGKYVINDKQGSMQFTT